MRPMTNPSGNRKPATQPNADTSDVTVLLAQRRKID